MSEHRLDRIVIERPRSGWRIKSHKKIRKAIKQNLQQVKYDYEREEISSLKPCYKEAIRIVKTKHFSDLLNPLFNWLRSKQGLPWNIVYGELSRLLDFNTLSGQHILFHVWQFVARNAVIVDGIPYDKNSFYGGMRKLGLWHDEMYVHPDTGILCLLQKQAKPKPKPKKLNDILWIDRTHQYRLLDGIWYSIAFCDVPSPTISEKGKINPVRVRDVILKETVTFKELFPKNNPPKYAYKKRQCNKKEIRYILEKIKTNSVD
jgi:hypothetical protein